MRLAPVVSIGLVSVAMSCLVIASFVPWQEGSILGIDISPGIWTLQYDSFRGSVTETYGETDAVDDDVKGRIILIQVVYVMAVVATVLAFVAWMGGLGPPPSGTILASTAAALTTLVVILFEVGVRSTDDSAGEFFDWTHGMGLATASAVLLAAAAAARRFIPPSLELVDRGDPPPEDRP